MKILPQKPTRLLVLFSALVALVAGEWWYRHWRPTQTFATDHYSIRSSATAEQTREVGRVLEALYAAYVQVLADFPQTRQPHPKLQIKLFKDRREFRRCHRGIGWAEAFYRKPYCHAYYSAIEINPCHWVLHEAVHQLNHEVARLGAPKWMDEGLGEYFGASVIEDGVLKPGQVDRYTYPIWWVGDMELSGDMEKDLAKGEILPLRVIVSGQGGPDLDEHFNLYYIHWWSSTHFLFEGEGGKYREPYFRVLREGGTVASFEKNFGPIERLQAEWYRHLLEQWKVLRGPSVRPAKAPKG